MVAEIKNGIKGFLIDGFPAYVDQGRQFEFEVHYMFHILGPTGPNG